MREATAPRPLSVLVDARGLHLSGIGRYLREVLLRLLQDERFGRFRMLGDPAQLEAFARGAGASGRVEILAASPSFYGPGVHARMAYLSMRGALRADVAFFPHYDVPPVGPLPPLVLTVHDLSHFVLRDLFPAHKRALAWRLMRRAVGRARIVMTDAESTRRDLLERIPTAGARVRVVPLGVGDSFVQPSPASLAAPYLLCVGNRKPHKNLVGAVEVFARLRPSHPGLRLVLVGPSYADGDPVRRLAEERGVGSAVEDLGAVSDERLQALYAGAACFVFPSRYEGFGLPVLEAMAAGAPVVASDRASVPEVVGDAGLLADPDDPGAFAAAVERVLTDAALRETLIARGRERAAKFTWEAAATEVAAALVEAAGGAESPAR